MEAYRRWRKAEEEEEKEAVAAEEEEEEEEKEERSRSPTLAQYLAITARYMKNKYKLVTVFKK